MAKRPVSARAKADKGRRETKPHDEHKSAETPRPRKRLRLQSIPETVTLAPKKQTPEWVKRAADRAEARARGQDPLDDVRIPKKLVKAPPPITSIDVDDDDDRVISGGHSESKAVRTYSAHSGNRHLKVLLESYKPEYVKIASDMVRNGAVERDLIARFQVTKTVFDLWQTMYPEFAAALAITREASLADEKVVRSMYEMANGYQIDTVKILNDKGEISIVELKEEVPKSYHAAKFWLMNRRPHEWGKDPETGAGGSNNALVSGGVINVEAVRGLNTDQLKQLAQVLRSMITPNSGLKRLDGMKFVDEVEDAEVVESTPKSEVTDETDGEKA